MTILIQKPCTKCNAVPCRLMGAVIGSTQIKERIIEKSYNMYWCPKCRTRFVVERSKDEAEQKLTEKYIVSSKIKLKKL